MENFNARLPWASTSEETEERVELIIHKLKFVADRPSVLFLEQLKPLQSYNDARLADLVEVAGGTLLQLSPAMSNVDDIAALAPQVLIISLADATINDAVTQIAPLFAWDGWQELPAVKNNRVYIVDGTQSLTLEEPAAVETLEMLAEIIQPKYFVFGFESERWSKFGV